MLFTPYNKAMFLASCRRTSW